MALAWQGAWSAGETYQVDDVVFYLTASYVAIDINTNQAPIQSNLGIHWDTFAVGLTGAQGVQGVAGNDSTVQGPAGAEGATGQTGSQGQGFTWRNAWSSSITYNTYDCVSYVDGNSYICIANNITDVVPGSNNAKWNVMVQGGISVANVFGRTGVVIAQGSDYSSFYLPLTGGTVTGNLVLASELIDSNSSQGTGGQVLSSTGTGVLWVNPSTTPAPTVVPGITVNGNNNLTVTSTAFQIASTSGYIFNLPTATTLQVGQTYHISNLSSGSMSVSDAGQNSLVSSIPQGDVYTFVLVGNNDAAGSWFYFSYGANATLSNN